MNTKSLSLGITRITFEPWEGRPAAPENQLWSEKKEKMYHFDFLKIYLIKSFVFFFVAHPSIHPEVDKGVDAGVSEGEEEENCVDVTN